MGSGAVRSLALMAGNGAVIAFTIQNALDEKLARSSATVAVCIALVGLVASYLALHAIDLKSPEAKRWFDAVGAAPIVVLPLMWALGVYQP
jgi:hypothetical protein